MKSTTFLLCIYFFFMCQFIVAQSADDIIGFYYTKDPFSDAESQVEIYKTKDGTYSGAVRWIKNLNRKNIKDIGLIFLEGLRYDAQKKEWVNGSIRYPGRPGVFDTYMSFDSKKVLKVRGYLLISVLGKTVYWTKEKEKRIPHL